MKRLKNTVKILLSLIIGFILIIFWLKIIDFKELMTYISNINVSFVFPAIFFYLLSYFFRSERLRKLLSHKHHIPVFKNFTYILSGNFINYLIPIRAGEIAKGLFYKKNHQVKWAESLPSVFIDKIFDTFAIFVVLLLIPFTSVVFSPYLNILLILLIIVFCLSISVLVLASISEKFVVRFLQKTFFFLPDKYKQKVYSFIHLFVEGIAIFKHHKIMFIPCILLTFSATLSDSVFFFLMFRAFGVDINFAKILFGYTLIFLSYILPHPPAQIGSNELIMILIFAIGFGLDENLVSAVMSFSHLITAIVIFITGTLSLAYAGIRLIDIIKNKEIRNE